MQIIAIYRRLVGALDSLGSWLPHLGLRLLLGYEYLDSGITKFKGDNWFADIQWNFLFPFNVVPPGASWFMATWFEIVGGILLLAGLATRFWAASLIILTIVATDAVHWGVGSVWQGEDGLRGYQSLGELMQGYVISNKGFGNFKLPLIFLIMFLPLLTQGAGRASLDHLLTKRFARAAG